MVHTRKRSQRGQALVEFAAVSIVLFAILFVLIDFAWYMHANTSVAEAARQGARQGVANALPADKPFASYVGGPCSGVVFTGSANANGCLRDGAIRSTVAGVLGSLTPTVNLTNQPAAACATPSPGVANLCVWPNDSGPAGSYTDCSAARSALGRDPGPGDLGSRSAEWANPKYKGCFQVQVTVVYAYSPLTPGLGALGLGSLGKVESSTTMLGEY